MNLNIQEMCRSRQNTRIWVEQYRLPRRSRSCIHPGLHSWTDKKGLGKQYLDEGRQEFVVKHLFNQKAIDKLESGKSTIDEVIVKFQDQ